MEWKDHKDAHRVIEWLVESGASRYAPIKKLEYFATSMRDFDDVSANLISILKTGSLEVSDVVQRTGDLSRTGLITKQTMELTPLGQAVLAGWTKYGVANANKSDEFARHLIIAYEAKRIDDPIYREIFEYWNDLRTWFDPIELIDSWDALYVLNSMDVEFNGFRPGDRYRLEHTPIAEIEFDLDEFASTVGNVDAIESAQRLNRAIQALIPRGRARATFSAALEIVLSDGDSTEIILSNFGYPQSPRQWKPFPQGQHEVIRYISEEYSLAKLAIDYIETAEGIPVEGQPILSLDKKKKIFALPKNIDFSKVLVDVKKSKSQSKNVAKLSKSNKPDYISQAIDNSAIGKLGEQFALEYENWRLRDYPSLQAAIKHVAATDDSAGYDIESFEVDGTPRYVEVKSTNGSLESRFFISSNEIEKAIELSSRYVLLRVGNLSKSPQCTEIRAPFDDILELTPSVYRAEFKSNFA